MSGGQCPLAASGVIWYLCGMKTLAAITALPVTLAFFASMAVAASAPSKPAVLPWVQDDYAGALAQAKAKKVPIFIDSWAPW